MGGSNLNTNCLEDLESFGKIFQILLRNSQVINWSLDEVLEWLSANHYEDELIKRFRDNDIDGSCLLELNFSNEMRFSTSNLNFSSNNNNLSASEAQQNQEIQELLLRSSTILQDKMNYSGSYQNYNQGGSPNQILNDESLYQQTPIAGQQLDMSSITQSGFANLIDQEVQNMIITHQSQQQTQYISSHHGHTHSSHSNKGFGHTPVGNILTSINQQQTFSSQVSIKGQGRQDRKSNTNLGQNLRLQGNNEDQLIQEEDEDDYDSVGHQIFKHLQETGQNLSIDFNDLLFDCKRDQISSISSTSSQIFKGKLLGVQVAIKKHGSIQRSVKRIVKSLIKELQIIQGVRHPNIVLHMGVAFDSSHQYYIISEYASKGSLYDLIHLKKAKINEDMVFIIAKQLAIALLYLHKKSFLHFNLKSSNVLVSDDWTVKICDYGIDRNKNKLQDLLHKYRSQTQSTEQSPKKPQTLNSQTNLQKQQRKSQRKQSGDPSQSQTPRDSRDNEQQKLLQILSELYWFAPEILQGEEYRPASDVYSFGIILWEMLAGIMPNNPKIFKQNYHQQQQQQQIQGEIYLSDYLIPPSKANSHLKKIINNCLLTEPERRPGFEDIVRYLEKVEKQPKKASDNPFITNLKDFLN
eukprot:403374489